MIPIGIIADIIPYESPYWTYTPGDLNDANLRTTTIGVTTIDIAWEAAKGVTPIVYAVNVKKHSDTAWPQAKLTDYTGLTYAISVHPNTAYDIYIEATDNNGDPRNCNQITATSLADTSAPSIPSNLASSNILTTSFTLSWDASTDNVGVVGYKVYKDGSYYGSTSDLSMSITGLNDNTAYSMTVSAYDDAGNESSQSSTLSVTTQQDTTPPEVTVSTSGFTATNKSGSVAHNSTNLTYALTPTDVGNNVSCDVVLTKNGSQIDTDTIILKDNTQYNGSFTLAVAADYGDVYIVQITKP